MDRAGKVRAVELGIGVGVAVVAIVVFLLLSNVGIQTPKTPAVHTPPSVTTADATAVGQTTATLNGNLGGLGSGSSASVGFLYGTNPTLAGATNVTVGTESAAGSFGKALDGLASSTNYYVQAWASGQGFALGFVRGFTTLAAASVAAPSVTTRGATSIGMTTATLNGSLTSVGSASSVTVGFLYGTSPNLSGATNTTVGTESSTGAFSEAVSGLSPSTTYYVQAWAKGDGFGAGTIVKFSTASPGNGQHVPPGWAHAWCPSLPPQAHGYGEVARCKYNMTYGEMKKLGLADAVVGQATADLRSSGATGPNASTEGRGNAYGMARNESNNGRHLGQL